MGRVVAWLVEKLRAFADLVEAKVKPVSNARWTKRLSGEPGFSFTTDYVSSFAPLWERHLAELKGKPDAAGLEIGSFEGRSAIWFLEHVLTNPTASMTCIDTFSGAGREPRFDHNLRVARLVDRTRKIKGRSAAVLPTLSQERFDFIYVDGSHVAADVLMDGVLSWCMLKTGGVLIFDDYRWESHRPASERPQLAIDLFLRLFESRLKILHQDYQVIVRKTT